MTQAKGNQAAGWSRPDWLALAFLLVIALTARALWFGDPVATFDEQLYSFIGWRMTYGELPYVDWWDRKPFVLFALFAIAHAIGGPDVLSYQVLALLFVTGGAVLIYDMARRLANRVAAALAGGQYIAIFSLFGAGSGQAEAFWVPVMTGMVWLLSKPEEPAAGRRAILAMLVGGLALQIKYTVIPQCLALGGWALWYEWKRTPEFGVIARRTALFALCGLLPTILVGLFYLAEGAFREFWYANFVSFFHRGGAAEGRLTPEYVSFTLIFFALAFGGAWAALRFHRPSNGQLYALAWLWFVASLATVFLPATLYGYYFAALSGPVVLVSLTLYSKPGWLGAAPGMALLAGIMVLIATAFDWSTARYERTATERLAAVIRPQIRDGSCLWIHDGPIQLYRLSGSCIPTRFAYPDHLNNELERGALGIDQTAEVARILANRPGAIVTADEPVTVQNQDVLRLLRNAQAQDYKEVFSTTLGMRTIRVWARRD